ncbi:hypothetical protein B7P43_G12447 [Cryptotermes secundus]|nr:hypothetical protein B7P43_G12447 [Cryptotermes secundus]
MGAEGKYDLKLAAGYDTSSGSEAVAPGTSVGTGKSSGGSSGKGSKNIADSTKSGGTSVLTSRKSSSTPSLPDATENHSKTSVASTEQAASADNLAAKQAAEAIAESVLSVARAEAIVAVTGESQSSSTPAGELSVVVHALRDPHTDLSAISSSAASDLATIVETLALGESTRINIGSTSNQLRRQMSCSEETNSSCGRNKISASGNTSNVEATKTNQSSSGSTTMNKTYGSSRANKVQLSSATDPHSVLSVEAVEVLDKMREGADLLRNNTNSFLSGELLPTSLLVGTGQQPSSAASIGLMAATLAPSVRISVTGGQESSDSVMNEKGLRIKNRQPPAAVTEIKRDKECEEEPSGGSVVVSNAMSVSVPNLTSAAGTNTMETSATAGLLETFATMARRRTLGAVTGGAGGTGGGGTGSGAGNAGSGGGGSIPSPSCTTPSPSPSPGSSLFPRGPSSVSSLVRLALSSNFPGGLLSTAQSYPSLTTSGPTGTGSGGISTTAGTGPCLSQALTMSLTSTSSDSEQDFLDSCRAPTLLAELEDDDEMPGPDDDEMPGPDDDENDDDENEDDDDYEEVMVSRNLLSFMEEEGYEVRNGKRRSWDDEYVLKRQFSALIPAFDPRPGRTNVNQTTDLEVPPPGADDRGNSQEVDLMPQPKLHLVLRGPNLPGVQDVEVELNDPNWTIFRAVQQLVQLADLGSRQEKLRRIWEPTYTIVYREVKEEEGSGHEVGGESTPVITLYSRGSRDAGTLSSTTSPSTPIPGTPSMSCTVEDVLQLLRHLFVISTFRDDAQNAADDMESDGELSPEEFTSKKITNKLLQQIQDPLVLSSGALPSWCEELNHSCPFLFPFETRQLFFNCTAFGASRSIVWLQTQRDVTLERQRAPGLSPRREDPHEFRVGRLKHERVKVPRGEQLLDWAMQVMRIHADRKSILEVEFQGEEGTGLGPTLEFYALVAAELQRRDLGMWLCDDDEQTETDGSDVPLDLGEGMKPPGYYVRRPSGLFPAPLPQESPACDKAVKYFWFLGVFLAKVLQDNRLVDLPLSQPFLKLMCHGEIQNNINERIGLLPGSRRANVAEEDVMMSSYISEESEKELELDPPKLNPEDSKPWFSGILGSEDLIEVDPVRGRFLHQLQELVARKARIAQDNTLSCETRAHQIQNLALVPSSGPVVRLEDLAITFTYLPSSRVFGYTAADLADGGADMEVTLDNVEEYGDLTMAFCLEKGIARQLESFHAGFYRVFPMDKLRAFSPEEVRVMLCGDQNPQWSREDLLNYTEPKLGYTRDSPGFQRFVNVLVNMSAEERKAFLQFTTGCSSLPPGGLANLYPRLTVVRKVDAGEGSYPSVNTCVHYLKLPDYPTEDLLRERLLAATREKGFHLN